MSIELVIGICSSSIGALTLFVMQGLREDIRELREVIFSCPNCKQER